MRQQHLTGKSFGKGILTVKNLMSKFLASVSKLFIVNTCKRCVSSMLWLFLSVFKPYRPFNICKLARCFFSVPAFGLDADK